VISEWNNKLYYMNGKRGGGPPMSTHSESPGKKSVQIVSLDDDELDEEYEMHQLSGSASDFGEQMRRQEEDRYAGEEGAIEITD
jgi:hypothetical protein